MKKILAILMVVSVLGMLVGCKGEEAGTDTGTTPPAAGADGDAK